MGLSGISPGSLLLILVIVALIFGTKKLRSMGRDLGGAVNDFKQGLHGERASISEERQESSQEQPQDKNK